MRKSLIALVTILVMSASVGMVSAQSYPFKWEPKPTTEAHWHNKTMTLAFDPSMRRSHQALFTWAAEDWMKKTDFTIRFDQRSVNKVKFGECGHSSGVCVTHKTQKGTGHIYEVQITFSDRVHFTQLTVQCWVGKKDFQEVSARAVGKAMGLRDTDYFAWNSVLRQPYDWGCKRTVTTDADVPHYDGHYRAH